MELRNEIIELEKQLKIKKEILFRNRLLQFLDVTEELLTLCGISDLNVEIKPDSKTDWKLTYTHTNTYNEDDYVDDIEHSVHYAPHMRTTQVKCGRSLANHYIQSNVGRNRFSVYIKNATIIRVVNKDYNIELDISEQNKLMQKYTQNKSIPEWLAIHMFLCINKHSWNDSDIVVHLSIV